MEIYEHGLAIAIESFNPLSLDYTTSLVKVQIRSDVQQATLFMILFNCRVQQPV